MKTTLFTGEFLSLIRDRHWEYVKRVKASGAAIIVAVTESSKLVLVEQYRIPCGSLTVELPAGIIGDEIGASDESHLDAARRELLEETGYAATHLEKLITGPDASGLSSELVTFVRATGLRREGKGGGIADEAITVHEIPLGEVHDWLETKRRNGALVDPKVYVGLYFAVRSP